jgi:hypothetical protein
LFLLRYQRSDETQQLTKTVSGQTQGKLNEKRATTFTQSFNDTANRTRHLDWGDFKKVERGCFNHPSIAGHRTMAASVVAAIRALPTAARAD